MNLCQCVNPHHIDCLMERHNVSEYFSVCMGGCQCACHYTKYGVLIACELWLDNRYRVARAAQLASQERHTDPRIEAVMPEKVRER